MWKEITNQQQWNTATSNHIHARFLQSWEWGEFQKACGKEVHRFQWEDTVSVQAIKQSLPTQKTYWYIPQGPVIKEGASYTKEMADELTELLMADESLFCRIDPITPLPESSLPHQKVSATQPQCTRVLDLTQSVDVLRANMHSKTRYNIGLAKKKGVVIEEGTINSFNALNHETTQRDGFASHSDMHYQLLFEHLPKEFFQVWQATYQHVVIASALVVSFGDTVTYVHGASSNQHRNAMAPFLLHWHIVQQAQQDGHTFYDWWGCNPEDETHSAYKKAWEGISRFKKGFGGDLVCYPQSIDLIYRKGWYTVYGLLKIFRTVRK